MSPAPRERVAVTGAHGYLGSHLVDALLRADRPVRALVSPWGSTARLDRFAHDPRLEVARVDVTDAAALRGAFDGCGAAVHAAGRVADYGPWEAFRTTNVIGTRLVSEEAARAGARRVALLSSVAVFRYRGFRGEDPRRLERDADAFAYGRSKRLAEDELLAAAPEPVIVRPALWPYGEGDASLARVAAAVRRGVFPLVDGGRARLQTVDARFLAEAVVRCVDAPEAAGRAYLVADDGAPTWRELIAEIAELLGAPRPRIVLPGAPVAAIATAAEAIWSRAAPRAEPPLTRYRAAMMRRDVVFDASAVRRELGLVPRRSRREALREALGLPETGA